MNYTNFWIDGRSFEKARNHFRAAVADPKARPNQKVVLDLNEHAYMLGMELTHGYPFIRNDGLSMTIHDHELTPRENSYNIIDLINIRFTERALKGAYTNLVYHEEAQQFEEKLSNLNVQRREDALKFSEEVCRWGRGMRVWGRLNQHYSQSQLGEAISSWLSSVRNYDSYIDPISQGVSIRGLGVSFASKHLRLLDPSRFAVLDSVLSEGLGYALTPQGYNLFMNDLVKIKNDYLQEWRLCDIEASIFALVRQRVITTG
ncbi:hypothetical protein HH1059_20180 [Halorhodospira halochloris]|uniref:Uncharacterized protein n=1 Tax=Halorhodospira halochloris TaxID=1052 RepID=A0A2Z6EZR9_HALHR|nr:hypothetical protein [Halorhodospira halochloris]MBK1652757.1 hypothetical protein [Halorhodospira halochloris]BBE11147.1 hypothetical protein HH1059_20180 [Halorhodospira halochloris]